KIQAVEIGKNNRIEQTPIHDLNLPANPHGYWLFGSLDFQSGNMISSQSRYDHFDIAPCLFPPAILVVSKALKNPLERKAGEKAKKYSI
ncbi:MAG: hypothetical protein SOR90_05185, partial [Oscillospiraceae bacterium]|nr:hypothetical protein [Oscillospiraceae bacterium]